MRDHTTLEQLLVLANLESLHAEPKRSGDSLPKAARRGSATKQFIHMSLAQPDLLAELVPKILHIMETALPLPHGVPILVEKGTGKNWLAAH